MKYAWLLLFGAGLCTGPGYWAWCYFFSGSCAGRYAVIPAAAGESAAPRGGGGRGTVSFPLDPAMNPVRIRAGITYRYPGIVSRRNRYTAVLEKDGDEVWKEDFSFSAGGKTRRKRRGSGIRVSVGGSRTTYVGVATFDVEKPGTYTLRVTSRGKPGIKVSRMEIYVVANAVAPRFEIVTIGFFLCAVGLMGMFLLMYTSVTRKKRSTANR